MRSTTMLLILLVAGLAGAESLQLNATYPLDPQLSHGSSNWHPQGLGFDEYAGELLFMQQSSDTIYRTDLVGSVLGSRTIGPIMYNPTGATASTANHTTGVAASATDYYISDYTNNSTGYDMYVLGKPSGAATSYSLEVAAFGGYPIDIRGTTLYKANTSSNYNWSNLNQIRTADLATPDVITQTQTLVGTSGMGDFAIDLDGGFIWVLEFLPSASIRLYDLATGAQVDTFPLGLEGETAGLTYFADTLYHYDWVSGSGSTLRVYDVIRPAQVRVVDAAPSTVVAGFGGYPVTVTVENTGVNAVNVTTVDLIFTGTANRTSEYTVTPDPVNPGTIAAAATETFTFSVDVSPTATLEPITIDASFAGTDTVSGATIVDAEADTTDLWDVVACLAPLCGDCTADGQVSILDALTGAQHSAGLLTLSGADFSNCNVNGLLEPDPGASVDILDALSIAQFTAGLGVSLVCC